MKYIFAMPLIAGVMLATGQFFMKRLAISIPTGAGILDLIVMIFTTRDTYVFLIVNLAASLVYVASLRYLSVGTVLALSFVMMMSTALLLDVFVNHTTVSTRNIFGFAFAVFAVLLIADRTNVG